MVGDAGVEAGIERFLAIAHGYGLVIAQLQGAAIEQEAIALSEGPSADHLKAPQGAIHKAAGAAAFHGGVAQQGPGFEGAANLQGCRFVVRIGPVQ